MYGLALPRLIVFSLLLSLQVGCAQLLGFDSVTECTGAACAVSDAGTDAAGAECMESSECAASTPICDSDEQECRLCTTSDECADRDPSLVGCAPDGTCVECAAHDDCDSEICDLTTHTCVEASSIIYLDPAGGTAPSCGTQNDPCKRFLEALAHVGTERDQLRARAGTYNADTTTIAVPAGITATLTAEGATFDLAPSEPVFSIGVGASFTIVGGTVTDATSSAGIVCGDATSTLRLEGTTVSDNGTNGVLCNGTVVVLDATFSGNPVKAIDASGGANLTVERSTFTGNDMGVDAADTTVIRQASFTGNTDVAVHCGPATDCTVERTLFKSNAGGGLCFNQGGGSIINNVFRENGGAVGGSIGAISFLFPDDDVLFAFNTVIDNNSAGAQSGGVHCTDDLGRVTSPNNLVHNNLNAMGKDSDFVGICNFTYSNVGDGAGNTNIDIEPQFKNFDTHELTADSPCVGVARFGSLTVEVDFDGEPRPFGDEPDCGADEFVP